MTHAAPNTKYRFIVACVLVHPLWSKRRISAQYLAASILLDASRSHGHRTERAAKQVATMARRKKSNGVEAIAGGLLAALTRRKKSNGVGALAGAQLVQLDPYGKPQGERWLKELDYFVQQHLKPTLTAAEQVTLSQNRVEVLKAIDVQVAAVTATQNPFAKFADDFTPREFETFCAETLRKHGWDARVTQQSRDQGVDVVAFKASRRVVVQCKLYSSPVGNKPVQEVAAGRAHEQADFGIVVSNNRYTAAAEELAKTNRVLLLHYRDLPNLDAILDRHEGIRTMTTPVAMSHNGACRVAAARQPTSALRASEADVRRKSALRLTPCDGVAVQ
ncbi:restriction endonuclease [Metallibacterium sp.]